MKYAIYRTAKLIIIGALMVICAVLFYAIRPKPEKPYDSGPTTLYKGDTTKLRRIE